MLHQIDENKASMVAKLLEHWQAGEVAEKAWLSDYCGSRYEQLLEMHACLRTLFPYDQELVYGWVTARSKAFDGKAPLEIMLNESDGIAQALHYLRCALQK
ncbi:MAG: antitoxin Xre/MbcA/ParS toxin-binding domain-containing protein [Pseudomonadota bacterium]